MNTAYHTNHTDVKKIAKAAYPNYNGRKFAVKIANHPLNVSSYWEGGSRDYFVFLRLDNLQTYEVPPQSMYDPKIKGTESVKIVPGMLCVKHTYFCGKDLGITIYVHPDNAPNLLPDTNTELTRDEKIVLVYTKTYKNTYGGRTDIRFQEAREKGISLEEWNKAVSSLQDKKMLNKARAITNEGKNAVGGLDRNDL